MYHFSETQRTRAYRIALLVGCFGLFLFVSSAHAWNPLVVRGRCQQSGVQCSSTVGNAGGQGACCDPQSSTIASCESNNRCAGGCPYKWAANQIPLTWFFNPNGMAGKSGYAGLTEAQLEADLKRAFDVWTKPVCTSFRHSYQGKTTTTPSFNRPLVMFLATDAQWAQLGAHSSTLAFTRPIPSNNGALQDGDIYFNPRPGNRGWGISPNVARGNIDFADVAAHEMGHAIGFAHTNNKVLMYYSIRCTGNCFRSTLFKDDQDAVCTTYPRTGPCSSDADCGGCLRCSSGKCVAKNIPQARNLCKPCTQPSDCGGASDICVRLTEGNRCSMACDSQDCCPNGYRCTQLTLSTKVCIPEAGACAPVSCTTDAQCGPGEQCGSSKTCEPKPVAVAANSCKLCANSSECGSGNACIQVDTVTRCAQPCVADNFCPTGYFCKSTSAGRRCVPEDNICPCTQDSQCDTGQVCRNNKCQKLGGGKFGDTCSDTTPCAAGYSCVDTGQSKICIQPCGRANTANGAPGGPCRSDGSCDGGAQCFRAGGGTICMPQSCPTGNCASAGGQCYQVGNGVGNRCLCTSDAQCGAGKVCNTSLLKQVFGQNIGACATPSTPAKCETGYDCVDATQQGQPACNTSQPDGCFCFPGKTQGPGDPCGQKQCKDGNVCVRTSQTSTDGYCLRTCPSGTCDIGGICQDAGNVKVCICGSSAQCSNGGTCKIFTGVNYGSCTTGGTNPCGDGTCSASENCSTCPADCKCPSGQSCQSGTCKGGDCGNNACEGAKGENCSTCPADCGCGAGKSCQNGACVEPSDCGNNACEGAKGESCSTCPADCGCGTGKSCQNGACVEAKDCGNNACEGAKGENCSTCPQDCACGSGQSCVNETCTTTVNKEPTGDAGTGTTGECKDDEYKDCDSEGKNCVCVQGTPPGCAGCSSVDSPSASFPYLLFVLFGLLLVNIRRRRD